MKRVKLLLDEHPSTSTYFDQNKNGFAPAPIDPTLQFQSPDERITKSSRSEISISISNPKDKEIYNVGDVINVQLIVPSEYSNLSVIVSNDAGSNRFFELGQDNASFNLDLTPDLIGTLRIIAFIIDNEDKFAIDSLSINVLPISKLDSISFINDEINIPLGQSMPLGIVGYLNNSTFINLSQAVKLQYNVDNTTIAYIDDVNLLHALNLGTTYIMASYQGIETYIKVNVYEGDDWINAPTCTTPNTPISTDVYDIGQNSATLSWIPSNPIGSPTVIYNWVIGTSPLVTFGNGVTQGTSYGSLVTTSSLSPGTTYYLRVYATTTCNNTSSGYITSIAFTTSGIYGCTTPGTPVAVTATTTGLTSANLAWAVGNPAGSATVTYYWVVGTSPSVTYGSGVAQGSTVETTVPISSLSPGINYYLRVYGITNCNYSSSGHGTSSVFTTSGSGGCITPGSPVDVFGTATGLNSANLDWSAGNPAGSPTVTYYWVVGTNTAVTYGNGVAQGSTTNTWLSTSSLSPGTTYYLRVYATTNCNNTSSGYGTSYAFTTSTNSGCITPGLPVAVSGIATGQNSANLDWSAGNPAGSPTVTYYWVIGTNPSVTYGNGVAQGSTTNTWLSTSSLSPGTSYYLRVYATTSCNNTSSGYGTSYAFTTSTIVGFILPDHTISLFMVLLQA
ncbi:MAG: hypothetical protein IPO92_19990 [Saprospiraceae bacterium]|nr:hypothetical protein [Saprospiraceae bacterium]